MEAEDSACKEETKALTVKNRLLQDVYSGLAMQGRQREGGKCQGARGPSLQGCSETLLGMVTCSPRPLWETPECRLVTVP